jgi:hypothetical protein
MNSISKSPDRHTFQAESSKKKLEENPNDENALSMIDFYQTWKEEADAREQDPEWQKNNMEYDMRTCDWMLEKVRSSDTYSQNLYSAMCNNDFIKLEVIPILRQDPEKDYWGASWRSAGGIVANMRQEGDYIDWYCSGIRGGPLGGAEDENDWDTKKYVPEGCITDEIQNDLQRLGWAVAPGGDWEKFI